LAKASDPVIPPSELGTQNIAELLVQLVVSQSDQIIGKQGRNTFRSSRPFSFSFCSAT